jgi:hypothetical protein
MLKNFFGVFSAFAALEILGGFFLGFWPSTAPPPPPICGLLCACSPHAYQKNEKGSRFYIIEPYSELSVLVSYPPATSALA